MVLFFMVPFLCEILGKFSEKIMVFNHSVKVPTQYRVASKVLQKYEIEGASMRDMIYNQKHAVRSRKMRPGSCEAHYMLSFFRG